MSAPPKAKITPGEYLERERKAETKSEYFNGEVFAMAGSSYEHCQVGSNLMAAIAARLVDRPCRVVANDMRVKVQATGL